MHPQVLCETGGVPLQLPVRRYTTKSRLLPHLALCSSLPGSLCEAKSWAGQGRVIYLPHLEVVPLQQECCTTHELWILTLSNQYLSEVFNSFKKNESYVSLKKNKFNKESKSSSTWRKQSCSFLKKNKIIITTLTRSLLQKKATTLKMERNWYADAERLKAEGLSTSGGCQV